MRKLAIALTSLLLFVGATRVGTLPPYNSTTDERKMAGISDGRIAWKDTGVVNVIDYGADPTGVADSLLAFQDAIDSYADSGRVVIVVPQGIYYLSDTLEIGRPVHMVGAGNHYITGSTLVFKTGKEGIRILYQGDVSGGGSRSIIESLLVEPLTGTVAWVADTPNYVPGVSAVIATTYSGFVFEAISGTHAGSIEPTWPTVEGDTVTETGVADPVTWEAHYIAGVKLFAAATIENVTATSFPGDGFSVFASTGDGNNANGFGIHNSFATSNAGWGFFTQGADSNGGLIQNCTSFTNGIGGFQDNSFLGNTYVANVTEANVIYAYYVAATATNNRSTFLGNYAEGGQTSSINGSAMFIGGIQESGVYGTGNILRNAWSNNLYFRDDTTDDGNGDSAYFRVGRTGSQTMMELGYSQDSSTPVAFTYGAVNGVSSPGWVGWQRNGTDTGWAMSLGNADVGPGHFWAPQGVYMGAHFDNKKRIWASEVVPTTGAHLAGEFVFDTTLISTRLGWKCTASGTPGTWTEVGLSSTGYGPTGPTGADGTIGVDGVTGATGPTGPNWTTSAQAISSLNDEVGTGFMCFNADTPLTGTTTGDRMTLTSTSNHCLTATAAGAGTGVRGVGGAVGVQGTGGSGGTGVVGVGVGAGNGGNFSSTGSGAGLVVAGGSTSGNGLTVTTTSGYGITAQGGGSLDGGYFTSGGSGGIGAQGVGGAVGSTGVKGTGGPTGGAGGWFVGGNVGGAGAVATGGTGSTGGIGITGTGGATGGTGIKGVGGATGGVGGWFVGGSVSGRGLVCEGTGSGRAAEFLGAVGITGAVSVTGNVTASGVITATGQGGGPALIASQSVSGWNVASFSGATAGATTLTVSSSNGNPVGGAPVVVTTGQNVGAIGSAAITATGGIGWITRSGAGAELAGGVSINGLLGGNGVNATGGAGSLNSTGGHGGSFTGGAQGPTGTVGGMGVIGTGGATGGTGIKGVGGPTGGVGGWMVGTGGGAALVCEGAVTMSTTLGVTGAVAITGAVGVTGLLTARAGITDTGNVSITGQAYSVQPSTLTTSGTTQTVDWNNGNGQVFDAQGSSGNVTFTFSNPVSGASYVLKLIQGSSARTYTWPGNTKWPGAVAPTVTTTDNAEDLITCYYDGTNYLCSYSLDIR